MLIVDMPMPIVCDECPMLYDGMNCMATGTEVYPNRKERILKNGSVFDTSKNRFDDCPIKGELVRCKDCKYRPHLRNAVDEDDAEELKHGYFNGFDLRFPTEGKCPCQVSDDEFYSWIPNDDWFCADGERRSND